MTLSLNALHVKELVTLLREDIRAVEGTLNIGDAENVPETFLIKGLPVCTKCKKGNFIKTTRQTRSADEGMTLVEICNYCQYQL